MRSLMVECIFWNPKLLKSICAETTCKYSKIDLKPTMKRLEKLCLITFIELARYEKIRSYSFYRKHELFINLKMHYMPAEFMLSIRKVRH